MRQLFLLIIFLNAYILIIAQTFPVVVNNTNNGGQILNIRTDPYNPIPITSLDIDKKLVASSLVSGPVVTGYDGSTTKSWWHIDLPGTTSAVIGYCAAGSSFSNPVCNASYIQITTTELNIRITAGDLTSQVQLSGAPGHLFLGQKFFVVNSQNLNGNTWYEIYLPNNCVPNIGWVAGNIGSLLYASRYTSSGNGLSTPSLANTILSSTSTQLSWSMDVQPTGKVSTLFTIYKSVNGGNYTTIPITNAPPNLYTDATLAAGNTYNYYIIANYGDCNSSQSNTISFTTTTNGCTTPTVTASSNSPVNIGATLYLFATPSQNGTYTYSWTGPAGWTSSQQNPSVNNFSTGMEGSYCVTMTKLGCTPSQNCTDVSVGGNNTCNLSVSINGITNLVCGQPLSLVAVSPQTGVAFNWTGPNGFTSNSQTVSKTSVTAADAGIYTVIVTKNNCDNATNSKNVIVTNCNTNDLAIDYGENSTIVPPWQREGDDFNGKVSVIRTGNLDASWHLEIDVLNSDGIFNYAISYPSTTIATQNFNTTTDIELKNYSVEGKILSYYAVLDNALPKIVKNVFGSGVNNNNGRTNIIQKKWDKENKVYLVPGSSFKDNPLSNLKIPLKYNSELSKIKISFDIIKNTSSSSSEELKLSTPYINADLGFLDINNNTTNISENSVLPGEYTYTITYYDANYKKLGLNETGTFELTKIGKINNINSDKLIIFIAGWNNTIQRDIESISNTGTQSDDAFSIVKYSEWDANYFSTWYVAQAGANLTQRNAYSIGVGLDSILKLAGGKTVNEIDLICHSKGGLDTRALIGGYGVSYKNFPNTFYDVVLSATPFNNYSFSSKIKRILFLATPHNGANFLASIGNNLPFNNSSPALKELGKEKGYGIINWLNNYGRIPIGIELGNMTAYYEVAGTSFDFTDGVVKGTSSDAISTDPSVINSSSAIHLYYTNENPVLNVFQMYQHYLKMNINPADNAHVHIHRTKLLSTTSPTVYSNVNHTNYYSDLDKMVLFTKWGANTPMPIPTCPRPQESEFDITVIKSILSGATLSVKFKSDSVYYAFGKTDENGRFNGTVIPELSFWDSIKIEANGVESLQVPVNNELITSKKLNVAMFKSATPSYYIQYPKISLPDQNPITNENSIRLAASAINVKSFMVSQHNSDSIFIPFNGNGNVSLDSGYNKITVKFIGLDTIALIKEIYYFPDTTMNELTTDLKINASSQFVNAKMFINNIYYSDINTTSTVTKILRGANNIKFSKYGYRDTVFTFDSTATINLVMQPCYYSSVSDSGIINFQNGLNPQYWKNITVKNVNPNNNVQVILRQYEDSSLANLNLKTQCRKFVFKNATNTNIQLRTAIALDQASTPNLDSVYLMMIKDGFFTKYEPNITNTTEYDPEVQKLAFDSIKLEANSSQEILLMKKQPPIMGSPQLEIYSGRELKVPVSIFVSDPDSVKNDLNIITSILTPATGFQFSIQDSIVTLKSKPGFVGDITVMLTATHDFISISKKIIISVKAPPLESNKVNLFPNPTTNILNIEFLLAADYRKSNLLIIDTKGTIVKRVINNEFIPKGYHFYSVSVSDLPAGLYFVSLNDNYKSPKFIKY